MSRILGAGRTLEQVAQRRVAVEEFAARSDKLNEEHRAKVAKERQRSTMATSELRQTLLAAAVEEESNYQQAKAAARSCYERRKARIGEAYQASKDQGLKKVDNTIGGRRYELQKRVLQAEKDRDAALLKATTSFEEFKKALDVAQEELAQSERDAQRLFTGYKSVLRLFFRAYETASLDAAADEARLLSEAKDSCAKAQGQLGRFRGNLP
ncbi:MAG: hypothetical protein ACREIC_05545, partial [Limisphaerales bacterium]